MMRILAGDIGGTKTLLRLIDVDESQRKVVRERRYESALYPTLHSMLHEFLHGVDDIEAACLAVAGPVIGRTATVTNLHWAVDADEIAERCSIERIRVVNDFYAVAAGVPWLSESDVVSLHRGSRREGSPIAILGAGTGLGEAVLIPVAGTHLVLPTEGGHADFAPVDEIQQRLLATLRERYEGHVSYERVLSGQGLVNIYSFLRDEESQAESEIEVMEAESLPATIARMAAEGKPLANRAFEIFVEVYGAEAGNMALRTLSYGGVYLAGGIAAKNVHRFTDGRFVARFLDKGRFRPLLEEIPVDLITDTSVGLTGATRLALEIETD